METGLGPQVESDSTMADQHADDARVLAPERSRRRTALGLALIALPGLGGLIWFASDQYIADRARFAAYPLLVAGAGLVGGAWLLFGERAKTAGVVCGGLLATIAALYPTIIHLPDDAPPARQEVAREAVTTLSTTSTRPPATTEPPATSTPATEGPPTTTSTSPPATPIPRPPCPRLATSGSVDTTRGRDQTHVGEVSYTVDNRSDPYVQITGRLAGELGSSRGLYTVKTADKNTHDNTAQHNPGSVGFFMSNKITPGADGCWTSQRTQLGYDCVGGITFRIYFALIPDTTAQSLLDQTSASGVYGLAAEAFLDNPNMEILGSINLPTSPSPSCPG